MTNPTQVESIVAGLSEAQREAMLRKPCPSWWGDKPGAMPHRRPTAQALRVLGLIHGPVYRGSTAYELTTLGIAVRKALEDAGR